MTPADRDAEPATADGPPTPRRAPSLRARLIGLVLIALVTDQALLYLLLADGRVGELRVAPFVPPLLNARHEASLAWMESLDPGAPDEVSGVFFDALLGWCPRPHTNKGLYAYDGLGSRIGAGPLGVEPSPGSARVVLVGGSFARGDEVPGEQSWAARLDARLDGAEVVNLGVGGYGMDQAWLRLRRDGLPLGPDEVWLALFPQATARLLNVYRPALRHAEPQLAFKPRFLLAEDGAAAGGAGSGSALVASPGGTADTPSAADGLGPFPGVVLLPQPIARLTDMPALLRAPERFAAATAHDRWIARDRLAWTAPGWNLAQRTAIGRLLLTLRVREPRRAGPLLRESGGELPRLVDAIARGMAADAAQAGATFRVLVLPGRDDLTQRQQAGGDAPWDRVMAGLRAAGLDVFDASQTLLDLGALDDPRAWMPGGHYAPDTNAAVAEALLAHLGGGAALAAPR